MSHRIYFADLGSLSDIEDTESESEKAAVSVKESAGSGEVVLSKGVVGGASSVQSPPTAAVASQENASHSTGVVQDNNVQQRKSSDIVGVTAGSGADSSAGAGGKGDTPVGTAQPVENLEQGAEHHSV